MIVYTFSQPIASATISYCWANGPNGSGTDIGQIDVNGGGNMTLNNVCGANVSGNILTCNIVGGVGNNNPIGNVTLNVSSDVCFTTITLTNIGGQSGWVQGNPCNFVLDTICCPEICIEDCCVAKLGRECNYLDDSIPVWPVYCDSTGPSRFITHNGSTRIVNWSNGQSSTVTYIDPNELISAEVILINGTDTCVDSAFYEWIEPVVSIDLGAVIPNCEDTIPFTLCVTDTNTGLPLDASWCILWSNGATTPCINAYTNTEYTVEVWDCNDTLCYFTDTFLYCCDTLEFELETCFSDLASRAPNSLLGANVKKKMESDLRSSISASYPGVTKSQMDAYFANPCDPCDVGYAFVWMQILQHLI